MIFDRPSLGSTGTPPIWPHLLQALTSVPTYEYEGSRARSETVFADRLDPCCDGFLPGGPVASSFGIPTKKNTQMAWGQGEACFSSCLYLSLLKSLLGAPNKCEQYQIILNILVQLTVAAQYLVLPGMILGHNLRTHRLYSIQHPEKTVDVWHGSSMRCPKGCHQCPC